MKKKYEAMLLLSACLVFICLCCNPRAFGQNDYLGHKAITKTSAYNCSITQDGDGFVWLGTSNGLVKFDGYDLKTFKAGNGDETVSSNYISDVFEDSRGLLWLSTLASGISVYDKNTNKFTHYKYNENDTSSISTNYLPWSPNVFAEDRDGNVWVATSNGLNCYEFKRGIFRRYNTSNGLSDNSLWTVSVDGHNRIWIGTNAGGVNILDKATGKVTVYKNDPNAPESIGAGAIYRILEARDGTFWVGTGDGGLNKFDSRSKTFKRYVSDQRDDAAISSNTVFNILEDRDGRLWTCGTYFQPRGLEIFDPKTERFSKYHGSMRPPHRVPSDTVMDFYMDSSGDIFLTDNVGNVLLFSREIKSIERLGIGDERSGHALSPLVSIFEDAAGAIWFSYSGGFDEYQPSSGSTKHYGMKEGDLDTVQGNYVFSILEDRKGRFWVASSDGALNIFNRQSGKVERRYINRSAITVARGMIEDVNVDGLFWYGTEGFGLVRFDSRTGTFKNYRARHGSNTSLSSNILHVINQDMDGVLWLGTSGGGICRLDPETGVFKQLLPEDDDDNSIPADVVNDIHTDRNGTCWVTTEGGGLSILDKKAMTFKRIGSDAGFTTKSLRSILEDNNSLWISSDSGIFKFDLDERKVTCILTTADGLNTDALSIFNSSALRTKDGTLWFGGSNGVNYFHPGSIKSNRQVPPVWLTGISQGNKPLSLGAAFERVKVLNLDWKRNFFEFKMSALNYRNAHNNQYKYKLEGVDNDWYDSGTNRFGRYSGLPSGNYTLRVIAGNNDNVWNDKGVALQVTVKPPFWETRAFMLCLLGLMVGGATLIAVYIMKLNSEIRRRKKAVDDLKKSEQNLLVTLHSIGDAVISTDIDGKVAIMNPVAEKLTGWRIAEAKGAPLAKVFTIINPADRKPAMNPADEVLSTGVVVGVTQQTSLVSRNGQEYHIAHSAAPIIDAGGSVSGVVLVFRDVTEENALQKHLEQNQRMEALGRLAGGIAHDFNNMLGGIVGGAQLLQHRLPREPKIDRFLSMILDASDRAAGLARSLLTFSRMNASEIGCINMHELTHSVVEILRNTIDKRIEIEYDLQAPKAIVEGDASQLQSVLLNLGINASHAMADGGKIVIGTKISRFSQQDCEQSTFDLIPGDYIEITVTDTGTGISPENLERIFEPFFSTKEAGKGTGLGLSTSYGTIKNHGGAITVSSEVGMGTTFRVDLPLTDTLQSSEETSAAELMRGTGRILFVDDEDVLRSYGRFLLGELGYDVICAGNGHEALELYQTHLGSIDLVILDMVMPVMDGFDCFCRIREIDPQARIIVASGFSSELKIEEMKQNGLCGLIDKPYKSETLSMAVYEAMRT